MGCIVSQREGADIGFSVWARQKLKIIDLELDHETRTYSVAIVGRDASLGC